MALTPYETLAPEPLVFPIGGKEYVLKPVNIPNGRILAKILGGDEETANMPAEELWKLVLGDLWAEFEADNVPLAAATRAGVAALAEHKSGRMSAEAAWEALGDPKALEKYLTEKSPNRAQRRSRSTAGAKKTPSRASTKATTPSPQA